ncbi:MAG TPA: hypothetical protein PKC96_02350 [Bacilli bacterium]|nr:hypothetical protein [Bacilli bacterium]
MNIKSNKRTYGAAIMFMVYYFLRLVRLPFFVFGLIRNWGTTSLPLIRLLVGIGFFVFGAYVAALSIKAMQYADGTAKKYQVHTAFFQNYRTLLVANVIVAGIYTAFNFIVNIKISAGAFNFSLDLLPVAFAVAGYYLVNQDYKELPMRLELEKNIFDHFHQKKEDAPKTKDDKDEYKIDPNDY